MRLTEKELEQMKSVDIGAVAPESLPDVSGMGFDTSLPREERIALFLQAVETVSYTHLICGKWPSMAMCSMLTSRPSGSWYRSSGGAQTTSIKWLSLIHI